MSLNVLGPTPDGFRINANSFQQDAITTFANYQYATYYIPVDKKNVEITGAVRHIVVARRKLSGKKSGIWEQLEFLDYDQMTDDGHNIISLGISGDGVIHLIWDLHGDKINYRTSVRGLASNPEVEPWTTDLFGPVTHSLSAMPLEKVTYPRFLRLPSGDLLLEIRIGFSGLGDDYLYRYSVEKGIWSPVGADNGLILKGVNNNAYINGIDYSEKTKGLYLSWTYREFVSVEEGLKLHPYPTANAGINGPENNHDLYFVVSYDEGLTWQNSRGDMLARPILPSSPGIMVYEIPRFSGIMNQEGQTIDYEGNFHVINRENSQLMHYWRSTVGKWSRQQICDLAGLEFGERGKLYPSSNGDIYAIFKANDGDMLYICKSNHPEFNTWRVIEIMPGLAGEPQPDRYRGHGILSFLILTASKPSEVVTIDFEID